MRPFFFTTPLAALLAATPALAQTSSQPSPTSADKRFIDHVARDGEAEVQLAKLAEQKAASPQVKALAQRLEADHSRANQQLMQIAQKQGVQPPQGMGKDESALRAKLEKLDGQAFDRAFVDEQVADHQKDVQYFQQQATTLKDPQLKSFAQQTLPVLQQHLRLAQQTESQLTGSGTSGAPAGRQTR